MPKKKRNKGSTVELDTGIYRARGHVVHNDNEAKAAKKEMVEATAKNYDLTTIVNEIGDWLRAVGPFEHQPDASEMDDEKLAAAYFNQKTDALAVQAFLHELMRLREQCKDDSAKIDPALAIAIRLGQHLSRMQHRKHEPAAKRARKSAKALRNAHREKEHSPALISEAINLYDDLLARDAERKKSAVEKEVEQTTGIAPRTLRYHLKKRK